MIAWLKGSLGQFLNAVVSDCEYWLSSPPAIIAATTFSLAISYWIAKQFSFGNILKPPILYFLMSGLLITSFLQGKECPVFER